MTQPPISNTLTSDNLPALLTPQTCSCCHGSGLIITDGSHSSDPDAATGNCENCDGLGTVPYPGTFADHLRDLSSEVIAGIQQLILDLPPAQQLRITYNPDDAKSPWVISIGDAYGGNRWSGMAVLQTDLEAGLAEAAGKFLAAAQQSTTTARLDADTAAYRKSRAIELGITL